MYKLQQACMKSLEEADLEKLYHISISSSASSSSSSSSPSMLVRLLKCCLRQKIKHIAVESIGVSFGAGGYRKKRYNLRELLSNLFTFVQFRLKINENLKLPLFFIMRSLPWNFTCYIHSRLLIKLSQMFHFSPPPSLCLEKHPIYFLKVYSSNPLDYLKWTYTTLNTFPLPTSLGPFTLVSKLDLRWKETEEGKRPRVRKWVYRKNWGAIQIQSFPLKNSLLVLHATLLTSK